MTNLVDSTSRFPRRLDDEARSQLFTDARTANAFDATPVSQAQLAEIWELAKWAPTAANLQPLRVTYVNSPEGRQRLVGHMSEGNKAKTLGAPAVAVLAFDSRFHEHIPTVAPFRAEMVPMLETNEETRLSMARFNAALQAGYFVMAVRAVGFAAGPMGGFDASALDADFFPDGRWRSTLVVNIGHPGEGAWRDRLPRLDQTETVQWA
ncbi:MAG: malonic semialdehyde reductase [Microbacteriaceae bacterium]|jgi:3-hydroxypropanoate dehydrogenase|nr:malonic semialdehyde reductase [Microbacteriaceae bacterium]